MAVAEMQGELLAGLRIIEPRVFADDRGFFFESFNQKKLAEWGIGEQQFVQDNHSRSRRGVLRGLHYQVGKPQGKLVRVVNGEAWDVAVDIRRSSPSFGKWFGVRLTAENRKMFWIPEGFAHGFLALSEEVDFLYKTTEFYHPELERTILWNDPQLKIDWPWESEPVLSAKDREGVLLSGAETFE